MSQQEEHKDPPRSVTHGTESQTQVPASPKHADAAKESTASGATVPTGKPGLKGSIIRKEGDKDAERSRSKKSARFAEEITQHTSHIDTGELYVLGITVGDGL